MARVDERGQIKLPAADCEALGIKPGDEVVIFHHGNQINVIKREQGAAAGLLKVSVQILA